MISKAYGRNKRYDVVVIHPYGTDKEHWRGVIWELGVMLKKKTKTKYNNEMPSRK